MPTRGRPQKSPAEHKRDHTKLRTKTPAANGKSSPASSLSPPPSIAERGLATIWDKHVADLTRGYVLTETNIFRLSCALEQYANSRRWQLMLDEIIDSTEYSSSDKTKYQGNINSSLTSYNNIIDSLEKSVRFNPKSDEGPSIEDTL